MLSHVPIFSSLDKDQIKVVIDEVTRWLDLAEEGDWMTLPGIAGRQGWPPDLGVGSGNCHLWGASLLLRWTLGVGSADTWSL